MTVKAKPKATGSDWSQLAARLQTKQLAEGSFSVLLDPAVLEESLRLVDEHRRAQLDVVIAEQREDGAESVQQALARVEALAEQLLKASAAVDDATVTLKLRALPAPGWRSLIAEHPAVQRGMSFNPDTFPQALIAASIIDGPATAAELDPFLELISWGDLERLFQTCLELNGVRA